MNQRRRVVIIAIICAAVIALLVAVSASEAESESPGTVVPTADATEAQRASLGAQMFSESLPTYEEAHATYLQQESLKFLAAVEARRQQEAAEAAERKRQQQKQQAAQRSTSASQPAAAAYSGGSVWDDLAQCESGGNWSINTGNGYYGGLQMDMTFWNTYGDTENWSRADLAPRSAQIAAATKARDSGRGYYPWPTCARKLGLIR